MVIGRQMPIYMCMCVYACEREKDDRHLFC